MGTYDQQLSEQKISEMLINKGFLVSQESSDLLKFSIQAVKDDKKVHILIRHLEYDLAYKNSTLPYQVYKIEAFDNEEEKRNGKELLQFVVGYNFKDNSFACVPIREFNDKRSTVIHQKEGLRTDYYNSWHALEEYMGDNNEGKDSTARYAVWFSKKDGDDKRITNYYPVPDLRTAVIVIDTYIRETLCPPNKLGLGVWNAEEEDWNEWDDGMGHDIRELTVDKDFEIIVRRKS